MDYPRIKPELDRRLKFLPKQKEQILKEYNNGKSIDSLVKKYQSWYSTIQYIVDPIYREEKREKLERLII